MMIDGRPILNRTRTAQALVLLVAGSLLMPLAALAAAAIALAWRSKSRYRVAPALAIAVVMAVLNTAKLPESDLAWYILLYNEAAKLPLTDAIFNASLSVRSSEFVYNTYVYSLAALSNRSSAAFVFISTFLIYFLANYAALLYSSHAAEKHEQTDDTVLLLLSTSFVFLTFSLSGHLIRQYLAASMAVVGFALFHRNRTISHLVLATAVFTHNSSVALVLPMLAGLHGGYVFRLALIVCGTLALIILGAGIPAITALETLTSAAATMDDGSIPKAIITFDCLLLALTAWLVWHRPKDVRQAKHDPHHALLRFGLLWLLTMLAASAVHFIFFRFYFYIEVLRPLLFATIISHTSQSIQSRRNVFLTTTLLISLAYFFARASTTVWNYGYSLPILPFKNIFDLFERLARVASLN